MSGKFAAAPSMSRSGVLYRLRWRIGHACAADQFHAPIFLGLLEMGKGCFGCPPPGYDGLRSLADVVKL